MKTTRKATTVALTATLAAVLMPLAHADPGTQSDKNNMRNLGIAGAAIAGYGLLNHNSTATILGAAAGGYGAYKYEQDRKAQSSAQRAHDRDYYRSGAQGGRRYYTYNGRRYYMDRATGERHLAD